VAPRRPSRTAYALSPVDDSPIYYELFAPSGTASGAAPDVVLLDGIGCDGYVWKYLIRDLAPDHRLVHLHYRGHGKSPLPRDLRRVGLPDLADDVAAVLADAELGPVILCGHSMGVQVALETYRRHPRRVAGLILMCGAPENPLKTFKRSGGLEVALPVVRRTVARAPRFFNQAARALLPTRLAFDLATRLEINRDLIHAADFMPYLRGLSNIEMPYFLSMLAAAGEHSARDLLPAITVPTLVVAGERDGFTPPELSRDMAGAIPGAELLEVQDGSHTAPLERPEVVGPAVRAFVARIADGDPPPFAP
jgi:pimeloyl-ACP methyl ester carboxylesterase